MFTWKRPCNKTWSISSGLGGLKAPIASIGCYVFSTRRLELNAPRIFQVYYVLQVNLACAWNAAYFCQQHDRFRSTPGGSPGQSSCI